MTDETNPATDVQTALRNADTAKNAVLNADPVDDTLADKIQDWQDANKALGDALSNVQQDKSVTNDATVATDTTANPPTGDNPNRLGSV